MRSIIRKLATIFGDLESILSPQFKHPQRNKLFFDYLRLRVKASLNRWFHYSHEHFLSFKVEVPDYEIFFAIFRQVFVRHAYYFETSVANPRIIDCGGNIGMTVLYSKYLYPSAAITVFEPSREVLAVLQRNLERNAIKDVTIVPAAVSGQKGKALIYPRGAAACGNTLDKSLVTESPGKNSYEAYEVDTVRLSEYVHEDVDMLKLDIEGSEGIVMHELSTSGALLKIKQVIMEYHYYPSAPENNLLPILSIFKERGWETQFFFEDAQNNFSLALERYGSYSLSIKTVGKAIYASH